MPKAARICGVPACGRLTAGGSYCPAHKGAAEQRRKEYDKQRGTEELRGYYFTKAWAATSRKVRARDAFCQIRQVCEGQGLAEVCDHITPARIYVPQNGGTLESFCDEDNLQGACKRCHDAKTAREDGGFGNQSSGYGG